MPTWYDSKIIRIEDETPTTKRFWVQLQGVDGFGFRAGQFVTMDLPVGEKRLDRWRSYSIASPPDGSNVLEFCIVRLKDGRSTNWFFDEAKVGTAIRFKGPEGSFVLPENIVADLVFICTGTGVALLRSMVLDLLAQKKPHKKIHLIFGTRHADGILYKNEFEKLAAEVPGFEYDVALSRAPILPEAKANYHAGHVHAIYLGKYAQPAPDRHFYLCGWTAMVDEARANLERLGYAPPQVKFELYG